MPRPLIPLTHLEGPPEPERKLRFMEIVRRRLREMRYASRTRSVYAMWIKRYVLFSGRRHPDDLDTADVRAFLSDLAAVRRVSASTQNQAAAALNFLYSQVLDRPLQVFVDIVPAARAKRLPVVLTVAEVRAILAQLREPARMAVALMYGSGLRVSECVSLRVKDIDLERRVITVRGGKGDKDRAVPLADSAISDVKRALRTAHERWRRDRRADVRVTGIDGALARKIPSADREWSWYYVFPATRTFRDADHVLRRHHLHQTLVQRSVRRASAEARIQKRVSCHSFRHSFATHLLEAGYDIRTIQELMGHTDVRTTMIYTHVSKSGALGVKSPAERL